MVARSRCWSSLREQRRCGGARRPFRQRIKAVRRPSVHFLCQRSVYVACPIWEKGTTMDVNKGEATSRVAADVRALLAPLTGDRILDLALLAGMHHAAAAGGAERRRAKKHQKKGESSSSSRDEQAMADWIPLGADERIHPMMTDLRFYLTLVMGGIFAVMFGSNLAVAILGSEFGTTYVILNFVVPYGTLAIGMLAMRKGLDKYIWERSAVIHYGEKWVEDLFVEGEEADSGNNDIVQPVIGESSA